MLKSKVTISAADLLCMAGTLEIPHRRSMSKAELVDIIAKYLGRDMTADDRSAFVQKAVSMAAGDGDEEDACDPLIDDDLEACFDLLEIDNKEDFKEFGDGIKRRHFKARSRAARTINALAKARAAAVRERSGATSRSSLCVKCLAYAAT